MSTPWIPKEPDLFSISGMSITSTGRVGRNRFGSSGDLMISRSAKSISGAVATMWATYLSMADPYEVCSILTVTSTGFMSITWRDVRINPLGWIMMPVPSLQDEGAPLRQLVSLTTARRLFCSGDWSSPAIGCSTPRDEGVGGSKIMGPPSFSTNGSERVGIGVGLGVAVLVAVGVLVC